MTTWNDISGNVDSGDIFLFHGPGLESEIIEDVDGTPFSHIALGVRLPGHQHPLLWTSDEITTLTDQLDHGKRSGVHLLDAKSVFELCMKRRYSNGKHYRFAWRRLHVDRNARFMKALEDFMRDVDGRAFPSLEEMAAQFAEGKLDIGTNTRTFYCSELATDTYVHLGLLPADTLINSLSPGDFSSSNRLPLQSGATLDRELWFTLD
ncbi:hypothetical protein [Thiolapillus sp.]